MPTRQTTARDFREYRTHFALQIDGTNKGGRNEETRDHCPSRKLEAKMYEPPPILHYTIAGTDDEMRFNLEWKYNTGKIWQSQSLEDD